MLQVATMHIIYIQPRVTVYIQPEAIHVHQWPSDECASSSSSDINMAVPNDCTPFKLVKV